MFRIPGTCGTMVSKANRASLLRQLQASGFLCSQVGLCWLFPNPVYVGLGFELVHGSFITSQMLFWTAALAVV